MISDLWKENRCCIPWRFNRKATQGSRGIICGGKKKPTGIIDVAVSQSLYRDNKVSELIKGYGQIICDECHHVSAVGFEQIIEK